MIDKDMTNKWERRDNKRRAKRLFTSDNRNSVRHMFKQVIIKAKQFIKETWKDG